MSWSGWRSLVGKYDVVSGILGGLDEALRE
jgi:hypothetical protein